MKLDADFINFKAEDFCVFKKTFTPEDFKIFSQLSGDRNPLHHDSKYASQTSFSNTIVPLHLATLPLSFVAGMVFPGRRSLYLGCDMQSHHPIPFNHEITYSAKIVTKTEFKRVLTLRTLLFDDSKVYISAMQKVMVREDLPEVNPISDLVTRYEEGFSLITGGLGELGRSVCLNLAKQNKNLLLVIKNKDKRLEGLLGVLKRYSIKISIFESDLARFNFSEFHSHCKKEKVFVENIVHCASPGIDSKLEELMEVNYNWLKNIFEQLRFSWLSRQRGTLVFISSSSSFYHPEKMENYIAAKTAATNFVQGLNLNYAKWGLKMFVFAPGKIQTQFSKNLNLGNSQDLLPEQVAEIIVKGMFEGKDFLTWIEYDKIKSGDLRFLENKEPIKRDSTVVKNFEASNEVASRLYSELCTFFKKPTNTNWTDLGINLVAGWDSATHIELLMELEKTFGIQFTSSEISETGSVETLRFLIEQKLSSI